MSPEEEIGVFLRCIFASDTMAVQRATMVRLAANSEALHWRRHRAGTWSAAGQDDVDQDFCGCQLGCELEQKLSGPLKMGLFKKS